MGEQEAMRLVALVVIVALAASSMEAETDTVGPLGRLMAIKQFSDNAYFPSMEVVNALDVGDSADDKSEVEEHRQHDAKAEGMLANVAAQLGRLESKPSLGESEKTNQEETDVQKANALFAPIKTNNPSRVAKTIRRVVRYFGNLAHDGRKLTPDQLDQARKWYIESTAIILGRYAYDDTEKKMKVKGAHDVSGLKSRAKAAKKGMDAVDAARHMHKMGADKGIKFNGLNVLELLERTGRLAEFLSEIESSKVSVSTLPTLCNGLKCPPAMAMPEIQRHVMKSEQEQAMHAMKHHVSKLAALQKRESDITATINLLMKRIADGDPITGKSNSQIKQHENKAIDKASGSANGELKAQLNAAADKEDKARIVEAAGNIAEHKITDTMTKATTTKATKVSVHQQHHHTVVVPMHDLTSSVTRHLNHGLGHILKIFKKRHSQHKHLSTAEHKRVGSTLRAMAAHLMQVTQLKRSHEPRKQHKHRTEPASMPVAKKKKIVARKHKAAKTWVHSGEVAAEQKAMDHGRPEAPSQEGQLPKGSIVNKFIWTTLGKHSVVRAEPPKTLAELLKNGVSLMNGGQLHFLMHP